MFRLRVGGLKKLATHLARQTPLQFLIRPCSCETSMSPFLNYKRKTSPRLQLRQNLQKLGYENKVLGALPAKMGRFRALPGRFRERFRCKNRAMMGPLWLPKTCVSDLTTLQL